MMPRLHPTYLILTSVTLIALSACRTIDINSGTFLRPVPQDTARFNALVRHARGNFTAQERRIRMRDGVEVHSVAFMSPSASQTVLYFGGNMFTIAGMGRRAADYMLPLGANLVLIDYRGYGASAGRPSSIAVFEADALDVFDQRVADSTIAQTQIIVHGHSLGSFAAGNVGAHRAVAGVVLESSVTSGDEWMRFADRRPWTVRLFTRMRIADNLRTAGNMQRINAIEEPLLLVVGSNDAITPPAMTERLHAAAQRSRQKRMEIFEGADHNNVTAHPDFARVYREFLNAVRRTK